MSKEASNPECLLPSVKNGGGSVMIWAAISWYSAGLIVTLNVRITAGDYVDILINQVHLMIQALFPNNDVIFKIKFAQPEVFSWFEEHEDTLRHLSSPAHCQT
jgi:hypothetical protein